jgi:chromosome segregation ATPase
MMHLKYPITRAQTDEERCHAIVAGRRQCHLKRCDGFKWCPVHGGARAIQSKGKRDLYKFRSEQYRGRFAALAGSDHIKNLRDEIAVLRMLLQHRIDYFEKDLLIDSYQITMLIRSIASLSESCAKIEHSLNDVMDKQSAADIVATMLNALPVVSDDLFEEITRLLSRFDHADEKPQAFNLNVTKWNIKDFFTTERIISIRSEIGVLRIILEQRLNECHDLQDLLMKSSEILSTVQDIEKLVVSCHRLEKTQGILLNDAESAQFANELIALIGKYVPADQLDKVANEFEAAYRESDSDSPTSQGDNQVL